METSALSQQFPQGLPILYDAPMKAGRYHFDLLYRHSNELALSTRRTFKKEVATVKASFGFLAQRFDRLEREPKGHVRNVKMALTARFTNHLFAHVLLAERGLLLDAANCARSATETTAFYWLVCKDAAAAGLYDAEESPRPVEIRKRLEAVGINVGELREHYGFESAVSHVGNKYDNLQITWERERTGKLHVGGGGDANVPRAMLNELPRYIAMFAMHDPNYVVTIGDGKASVREADGDQAEAEARKEATRFSWRHAPTIVSQRWFPKDKAMRRSAPSRGFRGRLVGCRWRGAIGKEKTTPGFVRNDRPL